MDNPTKSSISLMPAEGLQPGTGRCQGCQPDIDQVVYVVNAAELRTLLYLCRGCAHKLCIDLLEFLCL